MTMQLRKQDLEWREIASDIVILNALDASYLTLNGSGALLWRMLATSTTRDQMVTALLDAYDVEESVAAADTDAFLQTLSEQGLLAR